MTTYYAKTHEKLTVDGSTGVLTISNYAIEELGDIVYLELPSVGDSIEQGKGIIVIESVKAASDVYAPVSGTVLEVNQDAEDDPSLINQLQGDDNWLIKIELSDDAKQQLESLMSDADYQASIS
jgi:glycine cleavage system H protein